MRRPRLLAGLADLALAAGLLAGALPAEATGATITGAPRVCGRVYVAADGRGIVYGDTSETDDGGGGADLTGPAGCSVTYTVRGATRPRPSSPAQRKHGKASGPRFFRIGAHSYQGE